MKSIKDRVRERELRQTGGHPENAAYHSRNYRRHFEGWSEYRETDAKGKAHVKRVYTGVYHRADLSDSKIKLRRVVYAVLWVIAVALFFIAATRPVESNTVVYVTAAQGLSVAALAWLAWSVYNVLTAGINMTLGEFFYVSAVKRSSACSAVTLGLAAVGTLICGQVLCALLFLLSALCCLGIFLMEKRTVYRSFLSDQEAPADAAQISV